MRNSSKKRKKTCFDHYIRLSQKVSERDFYSHVFANPVRYVCCGLILSLVFFYFPLSLGMVVYDNEFETMGNKS